MDAETTLDSLGDGSQNIMYVWLIEACHILKLRCGPKYTYRTKSGGKCQLLTGIT